MNEEDHLDSLLTKDLILSEHTQAYVTPEYVAWLNDPAVVRFSEQRFKKHSLASCQEYVASFQNSPNKLWAILRASDKKHIGNICAIIDERNAIAELRILLGPAEARGKGYGVQAWSAAMEYCFQNGMRKVFGGTLKTNGAMIAAMQKAGMQLEAEIPKQYLWEDQEVNLVLFGKFSCA